MDSQTRQTADRAALEGEARRPDDRHSDRQAAPRGTEDVPQRTEAGPATGVASLVERLDPRGLEDLVGRHRGRLLWLLGALVGLAALSVTEVDPGRVLIYGLEQGAIIALVALGLALVYTSTRVLNFAQGEFGSVAAFVVLAVLLGGDLGGSLSADQIGPATMAGVALVAILAGASVALAVNAAVRRLDSPFASLVATAAVFILLQGLQFTVFGLNRTFPRVVEGAAFEAFGVLVQAQSVIIVGVLAVVAVLLALLFRTPLGVALLASAQEPFAASLYGVSPKAMSMLAWAMAGGLGGVAGLLLGGIYRGIQPGFVTTDYLVPAFTAALLGGITSMTGAVVGALLLGVVVAAAQQAISGYGLDGIVPNAPVAASFFVLLIVLAVRPTGLLGKET